MPKFYTSLQKSQSDISRIRIGKESLPVGVIGESCGFSWGFNGDYYYVAEGFLDHLVTKIHLNFEEAKQIFNALVFLGDNSIHAGVFSKAVKSARAKNLSGDRLMWFFLDFFENDSK